MRTHTTETASRGSKPPRVGKTKKGGTNPDLPQPATPEKGTAAPRATIAERPGFRDANVELKRSWMRSKIELEEAEAAGETQRATIAANELNRIATEFFTKNKGLAVGGAKPFLAPGDQNGDDYVSAASLGLWEAFHRWDPEKGVTFGTFSRQFIKGRIMRSVRATEYGHISQTDFNRRKEVRDTLQRLTDELDRVPTREEIAKVVGLNVNAVNRALAPAVTSLDLPVGDGDSTLGDIVAADKEFSEGLQIDLEDQSQVDRLLDELNELELWVVHARGGLLGTPPQSLVEIADEIGVGREIARRSEAKARARLLYTTMSIDLGRVPSWGEFATDLKITDDVTTSDGRIVTPADQAQSMVQPTWTDLYGRWRRASLALTDARTARDWGSSERRRARLDRLGEELMVLGAKHIAEQAVFFCQDDNTPIGEELAASELWEAFRAWNPDSDVQFPAWYKRWCHSRYRRTRGARPVSVPADIADAAVNLWARIRRSGRDVY